MNYNRFQQLLSMVMALLVIISTLSFSIEKHYCGDHLIDVGIFIEAQKCASEKSDALQKTSYQGSLFTEASCCKNTVELFEGQDELSIQKTKVFKTVQKAFILPFYAVFDGSKFLEPEDHSPFGHYTPPLYTGDILLLYQVYLI